MKRQEFVKTTAAGMVGCLSGGSILKGAIAENKDSENNDIPDILKPIGKNYKCNCRICKLHKLEQKALRSNNIGFVKKTLKEFAGLYGDANYDNDYYRCVMNGSWPSAVEQLEEALEKAKKIRAKESTQKGY